MKSPKLKAYDSYQRFGVSKIAVLDSGFRRTKKPFEAEVCHFQAVCLLLHYRVKAKTKEKSHINLFPSNRLIHNCFVKCSELKLLKGVIDVFLAASKMILPALH